MCLLWIIFPLVCHSQTDEEIDDAIAQLYWYENMGNDDTTYTLDYVKGGGEYKYKSSFGFILKQGQYKNGLKDGKWTYFDTDGSVTAVKFFCNGIPAKTWNYYYKDSLLYTENKLDSVLLILVSSWGNDSLLQIAYDGLRFKKNAVSKESLSIEVDNPFHNMLTINNLAFSGFFIHEDQPTTTWLGMAEMKDGYRHGEDVNQGFQRRQHMIKGQSYGAYEFAQIRYAEFECIGNFLNEKKYGTWIFRSFQGDYSITATYEMDSLVNYQVKSIGDGKLITDLNITDSLVRKIKHQFP